MAATDIFARRATLSRALRLLSEFRYEQPDPDRFYGALAADTLPWLKSANPSPSNATPRRAYLFISVPPPDPQWRAQGLFWLGRSQLSLGNASAARET